MREEVVEKLLALNRDFYNKLAEPFARSREEPQPGFYRLLDELPQPSPRVLDVGCGEGRYGRFLNEHQAVAAYTGVDFSAGLLARAESRVPGRFIQRDLSQPGCLEGLGNFDVIACLATLQHIPGRANRRRLLQDMKAHLAPDGRIFLSTWQFLDSPRQRRKVVDWSQVGLTAAEVEPNDYLLTWQRGGTGLRYVCLIAADETAALAGESGLTILNHFRSDGREGDLNLYTVLR
ncbi:MAG TPA: methyltransferase domain-containing protein [Anaerolineae bacterium]